ncbi:MAG: transketolase [Burkholderiaceae bacterium]|jgi:transketolase|nr:transketolase [Burkholderiaceae bacterium]
MTDPTLMANALRALAMDAVQQARSGHPGAPLGMADMAVALWGQHLKHNPANPHWADRDRFVLSNGHASMLLYGLLHLSGYDLPMDEIRRFRQLHSKTPGHPEVGATPGVETTTGPLGQGIANAVGMALAEKLLAAEFNREGHAIVDHHTYVFLGDGCMMEGISHEACALAGTWKLSKLVALYDANGISIDGPVEPWMGGDAGERVGERFAAYGWAVMGPIDGHDVQAVARAITLARQSGDKPTLIICKTHIGYGSPGRQDTAKAHGEPFGPEEIAATRARLGWRWPPFEIPPEVYADWDARAKGAAQEADWNRRFAAYAAAHPQRAAEFKRRLAGELPADFNETARKLIDALHQKAETMATRNASQIALEALPAALPEPLGGSADRTGSHLTQTAATAPLRFDEQGGIIKTADGRIGRHINYGVREFGMAAIMNGVALHGGYIPYGGTFLTFSDYSRNAIRMVALMRQRVVHVFTHDSIGLGEDGPTHQSVEHAASLRLIPGLDVWRPADATETAAAWTAALARRERPAALLLSRQNLLYLPKANCADIARGGYALRDAPGGKPRAVIIATGSEVHLALAAQDLLASKNIATRVVSMPSTNVFDRQDAAWRTQVLPPGAPRVAVEAGVTAGWWRYGCAAVIGIDRFGESAPGDELFRLFGLTAENIAQTVQSVLQQAQ